VKRITIAKVLAVCAVLAALAVVTTTSKHTVPAVYASTGCSAATLNGNYAVIQPAGFTSHELPWQFVGVVTFNGAGTTSVNYTAAVNGAIHTDQSSQDGTYKVNPDCTGSLSFTAGDAAGYAANIVIIGGGAEVFGISTSAGDTATFDAKMQ
jgi:hypothetical protein